jgi:hypothetical protein
MYEMDNTVKRESDNHPKQEVIELEDVVVIINGSPSPQACETFIRIVRQMKAAQKSKTS